ncbi:hypothetical protein HAX54_043852 [Datura stramonium]|uniref:Uncharacterized protein n=1 Tax=Datura stramonium TaxID=4076 RepID=A0ABS8SPZ9_DATST|nr:hypothetical protein [Datura stramonium]
MRRSETYKTFNTLLLLLLLLLVTINVACASGLECNGTTSVGECLQLADGEEEFLMESETSTKLLAAGGSKGSTNTLTYKSLDKPPVCNANINGNCIGAKLNGPQRPCTYENRCKHTP